MIQDNGASSDEDRAAGLRPQPPAASSQSSIPSAQDSILKAMKAHLNDALAQGSTPAWFGVSPAVYKELSYDGSRPLSFCGVRFFEQDEWSWGWMLWVENKLQPSLNPLPWGHAIPAQAIEAAEADETGTGSAEGDLS